MASNYINIRCEYIDGSIGNYHVYEFKNPQFFNKLSDELKMFRINPKTTGLIHVAEFASVYFGGRYINLNNVKSFEFELKELDFNPNQKDECNNVKTIYSNEVDLTPECDSCKKIYASQKKIKFEVMALFCDKCKPKVFKKFNDAMANAK